MALKSGVFACLILALCVGCNNVMAQNTDLKETEKSGFIIPRSENLSKETVKRYVFMCEIIGEIKGLWEVRSKSGATHYCKDTILSCTDSEESGTVTCVIINEIKGLWEVRSKSPIIYYCNDIILSCVRVVEKSGFIIPRSENLGKETEKSNIIIGRSENLGNIAFRSENLGNRSENLGNVTPRSENLGKETEKSGNIIP